MIYLRVTIVPALVALLFGATTHAQTSSGAPASGSEEHSRDAPPADTTAPANPPSTPPAAKAAIALVPAVTTTGVEEQKPASTTSKWQVTFFGFVEFDAMRDSTQSFGDTPNNNPLLRSDGSLPAYLPITTMPQTGQTYGSKHPRFQATARNSRFGFKINPPEVLGMRTTGFIDLDFIGNQPATSENSFFTNPTPRLRSAYFKVESDVVDVLAGQYYALFGWQPLFFPATDSFLGIPNEIFGRTPQLRISKTIRTDPLNVELAVAGLRPAQRDSGTPDFQAGLRFGVNGWQGVHGSGSGLPTIDSMSIGVSAVLRKFRVAQFYNNAGDPTTATAVAQANGYGVSVDALIPVIPASSLQHKGNALTLTGSFVKGSGIGDLFTAGLSGGVHFPLPEGPGGPNTGNYGSNIDPGIVQYTLQDTPDGQIGILRVLKWQAYMAGFQYYLPSSGRIALTANISASKSDNIKQTVPEGGDPARTFWKALYYDANVFAEITPAIRAALSYQHIGQTFVANDGKEKNERFELSGLFFF